MSCRRNSVLCTLALGLLTSIAAFADTLAQPAGTLQANGEVSRRLWVPEFAQGRRVSAGLALGLRGSVRQQLDSRVAPAVTLRLDDEASVSVIGAPGRGVMLVWQGRPW